MWSEQKILDAINATRQYNAIPYGASSTAPDDPRKQEEYFDRLDEANPTSTKRPDVLVYDAPSWETVQPKLEELEKSIDLTFDSNTSKLPFIPESDLREIVAYASVAIECENSLWIAEKMPDFRSELRPMKRLGGKNGLPKTAKTPTIIIKKEDLARISQWERDNKKPIHSWQVFYDIAIGISLKNANKLIKDGLIAPTDQRFSEPGGNTSVKTIYKIYHNYGYKVGRMTDPPEMKADHLVSSSGHVLPYVKFVGGSLEMDPHVIAIFGGSG